MILCRKLFENLIFELLEAKYPRNQSNNLELYFDKSRNKPRDLYDLIEVLKTKEKDFLIENKTFSTFITKISKLKREANDNAHTLTIIANRGDIDELNIQELL